MPRRVMEGKVVANEADKTIAVKVERQFRHPIYNKYIKKSKKYIAHDEKNVSDIGDTVFIEECPPISKRKAWTLKSIKEKARGLENKPAKAEAKAKAATKITEKATKKAS